MSCTRSVILPNNREHIGNRREHDTWQFPRNEIQAASCAERRSGSSFSISQPHVRLIVCGKASHKVEFGSKLSVSMVDGIALVDHFGWDAFNESTDLITQIESDKRRYGCFLEVVLADGIYGTRVSRKYMKKYNIRFGGKPLGRPRKPTAENAEQLKQEKLQRRQDALDRIPIEGKFRPPDLERMMSVI